MHADQGFDPSGDRVDLPADRRDAAAGVYAEYGLTERVTLKLKGDWQSGEDAFVDYDGRGPIEVGAIWQAWRSGGSAVSLYAGYADGGEGRNAGYAAPGQGDSDWEARVSAGQSFEALNWMPRSFVELQAARRWRSGLPDEVRMDATAGLHFASSWMLLGQAYGGLTDGDGARWLSLETSVVRDFGDWSIQAGWRQAVAGRETPESDGPVVAVWRRF